VLLAGVVAGATVIVPVDFPQAVSEAAVIVRGHVTDVRGRTIPTGVESIVTVAVDRVLKGQADSFVSVHVPGGIVGRYRYVFVGAPTFVVGEQAVLLLKRGSDNGLRIVGLNQGVYPIQTLPGASQPTVAPPPVAPQTAAAGPVVRGDSRRRAMSVPDFESLVRTVMAAQAQGGQR
jgi:hypothetical protein